MARRITPIAIRREVGASGYEILTASGSWVSWGLLPEYNRQAVRDCLGGLPFPTAGQVIYFDKNNKPLLQPQPSPDDKPQPVPSPSPVDTDDTDGTDEAPTPSPKDGPSMTTIEDIVRRISGELDDDVRAEVSAELLGAMDARIQDFLANNPPVVDSPVRDVVREIIVRQPDTDPLVMEGIYHHAMPDLMFNIINGIHTYLPGPPGSGKTHSAIQVIKALGGIYRAISFGPNTPESRLTGGMTADGRFFEPALLELIRSSIANPDVVHGMILDEMDNGHGGIQATLNMILANREMTAPNGDHLVVGRNLVFLACANTYGTGPTAEFAGRNKLDAATLDRFNYLPWDTDEGVETALVHSILTDPTVANAWLDIWRTARKNAADHGLKVFVTMRGAVSAAEAIAAGRDMEKALMMTLGYKIPADQWKKMNPL